MTLYPLLFGEEARRLALVAARLGRLRCPSLRCQWSSRAGFGWHGSSAEWVAAAIENAGGAVSCRWRRGANLSADSRFCHGFITDFVFLAPFFSLSLSSAPVRSLSGPAASFHTYAHGRTPFYFWAFFMGSIKNNDRPITSTFLGNKESIR